MPLEHRACRRDRGLAAQVVSGIGFLGAGLISREGLSVRGLNTAATLWCSAAIGILAGAGFLLYATVATGFVVFVNLLLRPIVSFINRQPLMSTELDDQMRPYSDESTSVEIVAVEAAKRPHTAHESLQKQRPNVCLIRGVACQRHQISNLVIVRRIQNGRRVDVEKIVGRLSLEPTITAARWQAGVQLDAEGHGPLELRGVGSG